MKGEIFSDISHALLAALKERLRVIADHEWRDRDSSSHLQKLQEISDQIERCTSILLKEKGDPQLRHYLEQRSYDKALNRLQYLKF